MNGLVEVSVPLKSFNPYYVRNILDYCEMLIIEENYALVTQLSLMKKTKQKIEIDVIRFQNFNAIDHSLVLNFYLKPEF
jgi:hypothetical protein